MKINYGYFQRLFDDYIEKYELKDFADKLRFYDQNFKLIPSPEGLYNYSKKKISINLSLIIKNNSIDDYTLDEVKLKQQIETCLFHELTHASQQKIVINSSSIEKFILKDAREFQAKDTSLKFPHHALFATEHMANVMGIVEFCNLHNIKATTSNPAIAEKLTVGYEYKNGKLISPYEKIMEIAKRWDYKDPLQTMENDLDEYHKLLLGLPVDEKTYQKYKKIANS